MGEAVYPPADRQAIARALAYPYHRPDRSYLFSGGCAVTLSADSLTTIAVSEQAERVPVLAVGSNSSPEQLCRKFGSSPGVRIPVTLGCLSGADIVYCAYMTGYGSVPATLIESAGVAVQIGITWLNQAQLAQMHLTESVGSHTEFGCLSMDAFELSPSLALPGFGLPGRLYTYSCGLGLLGIQAEPVALAERPATGRRCQVLSQQQLQRRIRRWFELAMLSGQCPATADFGQWVFQNIADTARPRQVTELLQSRRIDRELNGFEVLSTDRTPA